MNEATAQGYALRQFEAHAVVAVAQAIEIPLIDRNGSDRGLALAQKECEGVRPRDEEMDTARPTLGRSAYRAQQGQNHRRRMAAGSHALVRRAAHGVAVMSAPTAVRFWT